MCVTGLPGSGKTRWARDVWLNQGGFYRVDDPKTLRELPDRKILMQLGKNLLIVDPHLCDPVTQAACVKFLHKKYGVTPEWVCFENDPVQCKLNVLKRNDGRQVMGMIHMMSQVYVIPPGALVLPVYKDYES